MTDTYNDLLSEELRSNVWETLKSEATSMSPVQYATTVADIAGIFDPTPFSDGAGLVLSVAQGDVLGSLLSLGGLVVPYVGDALAKPMKIAKYAPKTAKALEGMLHAGDNLAKAGRETLEKASLTLEKVAAARKKALERVKKAMMEARKNPAGCEDCAKLIEKKADGSVKKKGKLDSPNNSSNGHWKGGEKPIDGTGTFVFEEPKVLPDGTIVKEIEIENFSPDFDDYVEGGKYELWNVTGDVGSDTKELTKMMRETNPNWEPPDNRLFTLHHFEDGQVGFVPTVIHDKTRGGVAHTGGNSMMNNELF